MIFRIIVVCIIVLSATACQTFVTQNKSGKPVTGELIGYGLYSISSKSNSFPAQETASGKKNLARVALRLQTTKVELKQGTVFGFEYILSNLPDTNKKLYLDTIVYHPKMINAQGKAYYVSRYKQPMRPKNGVYKDSLTYSLSEEYEMVAGEWVFEIRYQDQPVISKKFSVRKNKGHKS